MAYNRSQNTRNVNGIVSAISLNDFGKPKAIQLDEDQWYPITRYTQIKGTRAIKKGCHVALELKGKFIQKLRVIECPENFQKSYKQKSTEKEASIRTLIGLDLGSRILRMFLVIEPQYVDRLTSEEMKFGKNAAKNAAYIVGGIEKRLAPFIDSLIESAEGMDTQQAKINAQSVLKTAVDLVDVLVDNQIDLGVKELKDLLEVIMVTAEDLFKHAVNRIGNYVRESEEE